MDTLAWDTQFLADGLCEPVGDKETPRATLNQPKRHVKYLPPVVFVTFSAFHRKGRWQAGWQL